MISEFPLFAFTTLTGLGAGALLASAVFPERGETKRAWLFPLVMLALMGVGALASVTHLGRPQYMVYMLANPTSSLVMEGIFAGLTCVALIVDVALVVDVALDIDVALAAKSAAVNRVVRIVATVLAVLLMFVQAYAYAGSYGNAAWAAASVWPFFVLGSLGCGFTLWALFAQAGEGFTKVCGVALALACVSFAWEAATFAGAGADATLLIVGAVLAAVAAACALAKGFASAKLPWSVVAVAAVAALVVARYGFYAASIL